MVSTLTSKGQITLPKPIRDQLGLRSGDRLDFVVRDDGRLEVVPIKQPATKLKGLLPKPPQPVTLEEMDRAIAEGADDGDWH